MLRFKKAPTATAVAPTPQPHSAKRRSSGSSQQQQRSGPASSCSSSPSFPVAGMKTRGRSSSNTCASCVMQAAIETQADHADDSSRASTSPQALTRKSRQLVHEFLQIVDPNLADGMQAQSLRAAASVTTAQQAGQPRRNRSRWRDEVPFKLARRPCLAQEEEEVVETSQSEPRLESGAIHTDAAPATTPPIEQWTVLYSSNGANNSPKSQETWHGEAYAMDICVRSHVSTVSSSPSTSSPTPDTTAAALTTTTRHLFSVASTLVGVSSRQFWALMAHSANRVLWDHTCEKGETGRWLTDEFEGGEREEEEGAWKQQAQEMAARVELLKMSGIFMVAKARDMTLLSVDARLPPSSQSDPNVSSAATGLRAVSVSTSIQDARFPVQKGYNRFQLDVGGFMMEELPPLAALHGASVPRVRVTQVSDLGETAAWVPQSIVKMVASTLVPRSLATIARVAAALQIPDGVLVEEGENESTTTMHKGNVLQSEKVQILSTGTQAPAKKGEWIAARTWPGFVVPLDASDFECRPHGCKHQKETAERTAVLKPAFAVAKPSPPSRQDTIDANRPPAAQRAPLGPVQSTAMEEPIDSTMVAVEKETSQGTADEQTGDETLTSPLHMAPSGRVEEEAVLEAGDGSFTHHSLSTALLRHSTVFSDDEHEMDEGEGMARLAALGRRSRIDSSDSSVLLRRAEHNLPDFSPMTGTETVPGSVMESPATPFRMFHAGSGLADLSSSSLGLPGAASPSKRGSHQHQQQHNESQEERERFKRALLERHVVLKQHGDGGGLDVDKMQAGLQGKIKSPKIEQVEEWNASTGMALADGGGGLPDADSDDEEDERLDGLADLGGELREASDEDLAQMLAEALGEPLAGVQATDEASGSSETGSKLRKRYTMQQAARMSMLMLASSDLMAMAIAPGARESIVPFQMSVGGREGDTETIAPAAATTPSVSVEASMASLPSLTSVQSELRTSVASSSATPATPCSNLFKGRIQSPQHQPMQSLQQQQSQQPRGQPERSDSSASSVASGMTSSAAAPSTSNTNATAVSSPLTSHASSRVAVSPERQLSHDAHPSTTTASAAAAGPDVGTLKRMLQQQQQRQQHPQIQQQQQAAPSALGALTSTLAEAPYALLMLGASLAWFTSPRSPDASSRESSTSPMSAASMPRFSTRSSMSAASSSYTGSGVSIPEEHSVARSISRRNYDCLSNSKLHPFPGSYTAARRMSVDNYHPQDDVARGADAMGGKRGTHSSSNKHGFVMPTSPPQSPRKMEVELPRLMTTEGHSYLHSPPGSIGPVSAASSGFAGVAAAQSQAHFPPPQQQHGWLYALVGGGATAGP